MWLLFVFFVCCIVSLFLNTRRAGCLKPLVHEQVLDPQQCRDIINAAKEIGMQRSTVLDNENAISSIRTSTQVFIPIEHPACRPLVDKVKSITGMTDETKYEQVQVLHYEPGQEYKTHYDSCHKCLDGGQDLLRVQTCLTYLNDCQQGGETEFPKANAIVKPKMGRMVQWQNIDGDNKILPCSFHRSCPVGKATKSGPQRSGSIDEFFCGHYCMPPTKRQASAETYRYMSAPDMYKLSSQTAQMAALNPRARTYLKKKSRSMFKAGVARAQESRRVFNASMDTFKQSIRDTVRRKGAIQRVQQEMNKYQDMQDTIRDMLVSVKFQGDVLAKAIDQRRYAVGSTTNGTNATKRRQYQDIRESFAQQEKLLATQQDLERRQRMLSQGIVKGKSILKTLQEKTYRSIETQAQAKALLQMAKNLGLPFTTSTLRGLIIAEIDKALSSSE